MKWVKLKEIKEVQSSPKFSNDKLLYFDQENILHAYAEVILQEVNRKQFEKCYSLNVKDSDVLFYLDDSVCSLNQTTLDLDRVWQSKFGRPALLDEKHFYEQAYDRKRKTIQVGVYDRNSGKEIWKSSFNGYRFCRNFCKNLLITDVNFTCFIKLNLDSGNESWNYTLPEGEKVAEDIFLQDNVLVVPSVSGQMPYNKNYLRGIDINTGKELWRNEEHFLHLQQHPTSGLLYGFAGEKYQVIDPTNGNKLIDKQFIGLKDEKRLLVTTGMNRVFEDGLYFISDYVENQYDCQFGMINVDTHEIEFIQKLDVAEGVKADPPINHENRLYIKDSKDELHIYEKV